MIRTALRVAAHVLALLVCVLSAVVCVVSVYQWGRGYRLVDVWEIDDRLHRSGTFTHTVYRVSSGRGVVSFNYTRNHSAYELEDPMDPPYVLRDRHFRRHTHNTLRPDQFNLRADSIWQRIGFNAQYSGERMTNFGLRRLRTQSRRWQLRLPYWAIVPLTAAVPVLYVRRLRWLRRAYRARQGLCPGCGYDLRASTGRCPECGEAINPADGAAALTPSPGTPGEGRGKGLPPSIRNPQSAIGNDQDPHPHPLPEYREREKSGRGSRWSGKA